MDTETWLEPMAEFFAAVGDRLARVLVAADCVMPWLLGEALLFVHDRCPAVQAVCALVPSYGRGLTAGFTVRTSARGGEGETLLVCRPGLVSVAAYRRPALRSEDTGDVWPLLPQGCPTRYDLHSLPWWRHLEAAKASLESLRQMAEVPPMAARVYVLVIDRRPGEDPGLMSEAMEEADFLPGHARVLLDSEELLVRALPIPRTTSTQ